MNVDKIKKEIEDCLNMFIDYDIGKYELFYSKSLSIVSQLLPDRQNDFINFYKQIIPVLHLSDSQFNKLNKERLAKIGRQKSILKAALDSLDSCIYDISQQLLYNIFDDELVAAEHLIKNGFFRASGTMAGVVLEAHLKAILQKHNIEVQKNPVLSVLYTALYNNNIIDKCSHDEIKWISSLRNKCSHDKESEPTKKDVENLISGVKEIIATIN